jgi:C_GCAxxG_C_C family probable redox protein
MMLAVGGQVLHGCDPQWVRMTTGFAGGVGGTHEELCGALTGGIMIIGGLYGRSRLEEDDGRAVKMAARYRACFAAEFGLTQCALLREWVHGPGGAGSCAVLVERGAQMLLDLLAERDTG